jgi:hypothetical protein
VWACSALMNVGWERVEVVGLIDGGIAAMYGGGEVK